jgi:LacI family transcriptional regulator
MEISKKPATIYDIAKLAGVNASTVSRALSTPGRINKSTAQKVQLAAEQLNYRVNPFARALPTGRTKMLALMVADITNPVFFRVVRGAESAAAEQGYTLVIAESQESSQLEAQTLRRVLPMVDGVVFASTRLSDDEIRVVKSEKPVTLINRELTGIGSIVARNESGIEELISHLHNLGHHRVGYVGGPQASWVNADRGRILKAKASNAGIELVDLGVHPPTQNGGRAAFEPVRAAKVSAVIAYNDLIAIGLMNSAVDAGIRVPQDLTVVGFDNIFGSDFTNPPLTTVESPLELIGGEAVRQLLVALEDSNDSTGPRPDTKTKLIIRGSTAEVCK